MGKMCIGPRDHLLLQGNLSIRGGIAITIIL